MRADFKNIDTALIARSMEGDRLAQNRLYKRYSRSMFNICYRMTNSYDDAEDVLQEAFISAFKNLRSYKGNATFGAWLKRIVINKAVNLLKKKQIKFVAMTADIPEYPEPDLTEDALNINRIKQAVKQLPDGYRIVFSLYLIEGYDHSEIAEILGISASTSKSQFNRSKKKLKQILQQEVIYG
ncbi:MAG: RNA polymerase sigma factor [Fulvivirga sp.]